MTIGVCIMSYKYGHLVSHCIESILGQSIAPDKIWVVDDGVGDCGFIKEMYPQINLVERPVNLGVVNNFQDALYNIIDTDYVLLLGGDNWLRSDAIENLKFYLDLKMPTIITYDIIVTGELKKEILNRHPKECKNYLGDIYWDRSEGHHGSMLYNVQKAREVGGYAAKGEGKTEEDWVLYDRIMNNGGKKHHIAAGFLYYRRHNQNFYKYD